MVWSEWGDESSPVAVCAHGLTRSGRDFDFLAPHLAHQYRVVCPDILGRGRSDWLIDPSGYAYPAYLSDMAVLLARFDAHSIVWIGTSMGGLIGLFLAALPKSPVRCLVMNDIGPFIADSSLEQIRSYIEVTPSFPDYQAARAAILDRHAGFGPMTEQQKEHLVRYSLKYGHTGEDGFQLHYDPAIGLVLQAAAGQDVDVWSVWESLTIPVLVLRGKQSSLLSRDTLDRMEKRPGTTVVEVDGCGHAPSLMAEDHICIIGDWLRAQEDTR